MGFIEEVDPEKDPVSPNTPRLFADLVAIGDLVGESEGGFGPAELVELLEIEATGLPGVKEIIDKSKQAVNPDTSAERTNSTEMTVYHRTNASLASYVQDTWFPGSALYPPNPFNEVYVFPSIVRDQVKSYWDQKRQKKESQFQEMLGQLSGTLNKTALSDLKSKYSLATLNIYRCEYAEAESSYKEIIESVKAIENDNGLDMSELELALLNTMIYQGRFCEVQSRIEQLHQHIIKKYPVDNKLVQKSLEICIAVNTSSEKRKTEERHCRELVQITLGLFGPRHRRTLKALSLLAYCKRKQRAVEEGVRLYSATVSNLVFIDIPS